MVQDLLTILTVMFVIAASRLMNWFKGQAQHINLKVNIISTSSYRSENDSNEDYKNARIVFILYIVAMTTSAAAATTIKPRTTEQGKLTNISLPTVAGMIMLFM